MLQHWWGWECKGEEKAAGTEEGFYGESLGQGALVVITSLQLNTDTQQKKRNRSPFIIKGQEQLKSPTRQSLRRQEEQGFSRVGCVHASECKSKRAYTRAHARARARTHTHTHTHTHTPSFPFRTKSHVHSHLSQGSSSRGCDSRATANAKPLLPLTVAMAI